MKSNVSDARVAIIGIGNVFLGDDGFGCLMVERFRSEYECGPEVEISDLGTPGLDLSPYLYCKDLVVVVDAVISEAAPGTVGTYSEEDFLENRAALRVTDHDLGLAESLAQLRLVGCGPSELLVLGVVPESCEYGAGISPSVIGASSVAVDFLKELLTDRGFNCSERRQKLQPNLWWLAAPQTLARTFDQSPLAHEMLTRLR